MKMEDKLFADLLQSVKEMVEIEKGEKEIKGFVKIRSYSNENINSNGQRQRLKSNGRGGRNLSPI